MCGFMTFGTARVENDVLLPSVLFLEALLNAAPVTERDFDDSPSSSFPKTIDVHV